MQVTGRGEGEQMNANYQHRGYGESGVNAAPQALALVLAVLSLLFMMGVAEAGSESLISKTLTRFHDPVIVNTSLLGDLSSRKTAGYRLYSSQQGALSPIPFQFDERDETGEIVFPGSENTGEFSFDDNDELVFMAKDLGDRIVPSILPTEKSLALEI